MSSDFLHQGGDYAQQFENDKEKGTFIDLYQSQDKRDQRKLAADLTDTFGYLKRNPGK